MMQKTDKHILEVNAELPCFMGMLQSISEGVLAADLNGHVIWMNPAAERLTNWSRAEAFGQPLHTVYQVVDAKTKQPRPDLVPRILHDGARTSGGDALLLQPRAGRELPVADSGAPLYDAAGKPQGVVIMFHDDSENREAHRVVAESAELFRAIFRSAGIGMVLTDRQSCFLDANQVFLEMLGYTEQELRGKSVASVTHPDDVSESEKQIRQILALNHQKAQLHLVKRYIRKDGSIVWGRVMATYIWDQEGQPLFSVAMVEDITAARQAEDSLEAEKERLMVTLRSIGDGVIATDADGHVQLVNRAAEKLTGWTQGEAAGRGLDEVFQLLDTETRRSLGTDVLRSLIRNGAFAAFPEQTLLRTRTGDEWQIEEVATPIRDRQGRISGMVITFRDITRERQREQELIRNQKLESLGVLAGGIAHDFNNLLTVILGNTGLMRSLVLGQEERILLDEVEKASWRAKDLIQQLMTFAKGGLLIKKVIALTKLVQESAQFALRGSNCVCDYQLAGDLWPVAVDPAQIGQVVHNLLINAVQAMPDGGAINIRAANVAWDMRHDPPLKPGCYVQVSIADHGYGIPESDLPRIFDPYFTTKSQSSGLGLTTTFSIVRKHGGAITVSSKVGEGTTFTFYLPAATSQPGEAEPPLSPQSTPPANKRRILVMDDEVAIRVLVQRALERSGFSVELTADGAEAVRRYQAAQAEGSPFAAVILDLTIPGGMGGRETLAQLKQLDPTVKALVSSGYSTDAAMATYREFGFAGIVNKPYHPQDLLAAVRQTLAE